MPKQKNKIMFKEKYVVVRSNLAGVFIGKCVGEVDTKKRCVLLTECSRIYSWEGANTCSGIALKGVSEKSKITPETTSLVFDIIEVVEASTEAVVKIKSL
jgi:hypothetical protein